MRARYLKPSVTNYDSLNGEGVMPLAAIGLGKAAIISTVSLLSILFIMYLIMYSSDLSRNTGSFEKFIYRLIFFAGIIAANRKIWKEYSA